MSIEDENTTGSRKIYDRVSDAWQLILGDHWHYGWFEDGYDLLRATTHIVDQMIARAGIAEGDSVIDVGCGSGGTALRVNNRTGASVSGISISSRGVELANEMVERNSLNAELEFFVRDAVDNQFEDGSFDLAWIMESSHLMVDKRSMIKECKRVLKDGARLVLCDIILKNELDFGDYVRNRKSFDLLGRVFGEAKAVSLENYHSMLTDSGFVDIEIKDISMETFPTFAAWRKNIEIHKVELMNLIDEEYILEYIEATNIIEQFYKENILGYGMLSARKA